MAKNFDINQLARPNVVKLKPYSSARDEYKAEGSQMTFLDANESPFENGVNRYPDPHQRDLKSLISEIREIEIGKILLGNGSDEVLDLLIRAFCEPGKDNVISLPPTYGMYKVLADVNNIENREVLLGNDFQPKTEKIFDEIDENTKILFLCSPNNPTGNLFSKEIIIELLEKFRGLVVIDEAYIDFSEEESWSKRLKDYPNLVVTQTLSKAYGMAGIRVGICYASEDIITILKKIKPPYNVNELSQQKALRHLQQKELVKAEISSILKEREVLLKALLQLNWVKKVFPSDANFLLAKVDNANKRYDELLGKGIVVRNRSSQPLCENTLRFTIGTEAENQELIKVLKEL